MRIGLTLSLLLSIILPMVCPLLSTPDTQSIYINIPIQDSNYYYMKYLRGHLRAETVGRPVHGGGGGGRDRHHGLCHQSTPGESGEKTR